MKRILSFVITIALFVPGVKAHVKHPNPNAAWTFTVKQTASNEFDLIATATITPGWHMYTQFLDPMATPQPTTFTFNPGDDYMLIGKVTESANRKSHYEEVDKLDEPIFEGYAVFTQHVRILKPQVVITGNVHAQTCQSECTDGDADFRYELPPPAGTMATVPNTSHALKAADTTGKMAAPDSAKSDSTAHGAATVIQPDDSLDKESYWGVFLLGIGSGLIGLLMPCVWPVIPLTVSFFLKQNKSKSRGRLNAIVYGLSITLIFVALGILVSLFTNEQKLNELSSGWFFNLLFFVLFFLFALSFLGMFEIRVPSSWINKSEQLSDKGGFLGIFFMAFTLVLVSFSCTLPFIGGLIKLVTEGGQFMKPLIGFTAFGLTLGLPFAFFAYFPSMLKSLPRSGGWMTSLKVVFGFIELALCLIYLSKVDLAYHWGFLSRDKFLAAWIIIFGVLGLYLLGKIKLPHHEAEDHISVPRLIFALTILSFTLYMIPGLWGAPLKGLSGYLPNYMEFEQSQGHANSTRTAPRFEGVKKYAELFHAPAELDIDLFFQYEQALAYAKKVHKPLFIDFTGHSCVNCRYNEQNVWPEPEVSKYLQNDYVCVSLYVDDKTNLPAAEQYHSARLDKTIETIGDRNTDLQTSTFKLPLSQPYYVLLDNAGKLLVTPQGGKTDPAQYAAYLEKGVREFKKRH